jgi:hypothetical protein
MSAYKPFDIVKITGSYKGHKLSSGRKLKKNDLGVVTISDGDFVFVRPYGHSGDIGFLSNEVELMFPFPLDKIDALNSILGSSEYVILAVTDTRKGSVKVEHIFSALADPLRIKGMLHNALYNPGLITSTPSVENP